MILTENDEFERLFSASPLCKLVPQAPVVGVRTVKPQAPRISDENFVTIRRSHGDSSAPRKPLPKPVPILLAAPTKKHVQNRSASIEQFDDDESLGDVSMEEVALDLLENSERTLVDGDNSAVSDEVRVVDDAKKDDAEDVVMVEDDSDEPEVDAKPDAIELSSWAIKYLENCLVVEGQRSQDKNGDRWHSSKIAVRRSEFLLETENGTLYELLGDLNVTKTISYGIDLSIAKKFCRGFPENWKEFAIKRPKFLHPHSKDLVKRRSSTPKATSSRKRNDSAADSGPISLDNLPRSRTGRTIKPPLAWWACQQVKVLSQTQDVVIEQYSTNQILSADHRTIEFISKDESICEHRNIVEMKKKKIKKEGKSGEAIDFKRELITKKLDDSALDNELRICCSPIATKFNEDSIRSLKQGQSVNIRDLCRTEAKAVLSDSSEVFTFNTDAPERDEIPKDIPPRSSVKRKPPSRKTETQSSAAGSAVTSSRRERPAQRTEPKESSSTSSDETLVAMRNARCAPKRRLGPTKRTLKALRVAKGRAKPVAKDLENENIPPVQEALPWDENEINRYERALVIITDDRNESSFWQRIATLVRTRTAEQCRLYHESVAKGNGRAKKQSSSGRPKKGLGASKRRRIVQDMMTYGHGRPRLDMAATPSTHGFLGNDSLDNVGPRARTSLLKTPACTVVPNRMEGIAFTPTPVNHRTASIGENQQHMERVDKKVARHAKMARQKLKKAKLPDAKNKHTVDKKRKTVLSFQTNLEELTSESEAEDFYFEID